MDVQRVSAVLPTEITEALIAEGYGVALPRLRSAALDAAAIICTTVGVSTTMISLAQAPATAEDLSKRLLNWFGKRLDKRNCVVSIKAKGPRGSVQINLTEETTPDELCAIISAVLPSANANGATGADVPENMGG
jgi:hypothetical protein